MTTNKYSTKKTFYSQSAVCVKSLCNDLPLKLESITSRQTRKIRKFYNTYTIKGIIKLDVDDHLIQYKNKNITNNKIFNIIALLIRNGWFIGLSSHRNCYMLREQQKRFGTNGPNDAEFGAITDFTKLGYQCIWDKKSLLHFSKIRKKIKNDLVSFLQSSNYNVEYRAITDSEVFDYFHSLNQWPHPEKPFGLYLNLRRLCSLTVIAFKKSAKGKPKPIFNRKYYSLVKQSLMKLERNLSNGYRSLMVINPKKCALVLHSNKTDKTYPWKAQFAFLGRKFIKNKKFYHLGDGEDDAINIDNVKVLVPANAHQKALDRANRVSKYSITSGAVDNLLAIINGKI